MKNNEEDSYYGYSNSGLDLLKGKTVNKVEFTSNKIGFTLSEERKQLIYSVEGDC